MILIEQLPTGGKASYYVYPDTETVEILQRDVDGDWHPVHCPPACTPSIIKYILEHADRMQPVQP